MKNQLTNVQKNLLINKNKTTMYMYPEIQKGLTCAGHVLVSANVVCRRPCIRAFEQSLSRTTGTPLCGGCTPYTQPHSQYILGEIFGGFQKIEERLADYIVWWSGSLYGY